MQEVWRVRKMRKSCSNFLCALPVSAQLRYEAIVLYSCFDKSAPKKRKSLRDNAER